MRPYGNRSSGSGVLAYASGRDFIDVEFMDGKQYRYTYQVPGRDDVEAMKALAAEGEHLATYINQHVRKRYATRLSTLR